MLESPALNMAANLENSAVTTGLEKVSFHSSPKERQCQKMLKLLPSCTHFTHWQSNALNSLSYAAWVSESWTSRCSSWFYKRQRNQRSNCQHPLDHWKSKSSRKTSASFTMLKPLTVWITTNGVKFFIWEYLITLPASCETCMQVKK